MRVNPSLADFDFHEDEECFDCLLLLGAILNHHVVRYFD